MILGIDEVGRGAWAGPLVVGAVVLSGVQIPGLTDSKALSKKRRQELDEIIRREAAGVGLGWVYPSELDQIGLSAALKLATKRAVEQITASYHEIIIDGTVNFLAGTAKGSYVTTMKKADLLVPSVSAASIVAKVARDRYMTALDLSTADYQFSRHVGYGTMLHRQQLLLYGPSEHHRRSFSPIASMTRTARLKDVTSKSLGDQAETAVVLYLQEKGHTILDRNWKNRFCEIDIVSSFDDVLYFTEVKYRSSLNQGGGIGAITSKKLQKMTFASELYVVNKKMRMINRQLAVSSVSGDQFTVENWIAID